MPKLVAMGDPVLPLTGATDPVQTVSDEKLRKFNFWAMVLHGGQGTMLLICSFALENVREFQKDITTSWLVYNELTHTMENRTKVIGTIGIGLVASVFLLMSAAAHAVVLLNWDTYISDLAKGLNRFRWYEYAVSSSLMIVGIAVLFGCYDMASLLLIAFSNASMNLFGLLHEMMNPPDRKADNWLPFIFGCWAGLGPWIVVMCYFLGGGNFDQIPGFVYGILIGYFIFFNTFPVNMYLQYAKVGRWAEYRYGELVYIFLSLGAKSLLGWLVFGGTNQPNGDDEVE